MRCSNEGTLRAYLDVELPAAERAAVHDHLAECGRCREELDLLRRDAASVAAWLTPGAEPAPPTAASWHRLRSRLGDSGQRQGKLSGRIARWLSSAGLRWAAAGATAVVLAGLVALNPMQLSADGLLAIFRVQKFAAITIDPAQLPRLPNPSRALGESHGVVPPQFHEATVAEAAQAVDFPVRQPQYLPAGLTGPGRTVVSSAAELTYTVDLAALKGYLQQAGVTNVDLPDSLDGATLRARVPASILTAYGAAAASSMMEGASAPSGPYLVFAQSRGPALEVPPNVDVEAVREQVLALPILPPDIARQLRAIKDWRQTLVVPVRAGTQQDVTVQGVPGLLVAHEDGANTLLWQKDGVVYALSGSMAGGELMRVAAAIR